MDDPDSNISQMFDFSEMELLTKVKDSSACPAKKGNKDDSSAVSAVSNFIAISNVSCFYNADGTAKQPVD